VCIKCKCLLLQEAFLEDVNCILNSGDLPDLFEHDEMDRLTMELRPAAAASQIPDTRTALYQFFLEVKFCRPVLEIKALLFIILFIPCSLKHAMLKSPYNTRYCYFRECAVTFT
jgi:hypothetical protein